MYLPKPHFQLWLDMLSGDRNKILNDNSSISFSHEYVEWKNMQSMEITFIVDGNYIYLFIDWL